MDNTINVIPEPCACEINGTSFSLTDHCIIIADKECMAPARFFEGMISSILGRRLSIEKNSDSTELEGNIVFKIQDVPGIEDASGYKLDVTDAGIMIMSPTEQGIFYGIQTLRQLLPMEIERALSGDDKLTTRSKIAVPGVNILDYPRFTWRGFMLDCARHFFDVDTIKKLLDVMALLKMNIFHWHLTDDQGWRVEIKKYPRLVEIGSKREESQVGGFLSNKFDGVPHEGFFSKDDITAVINYAAERYITVIPEIEMPGHCMAALASYPALSCTGGPFKVAIRAGVKKDVYCAGKEEVFTFLENVLAEVMALFPSKFIHIGGDEVPKARWRNCPSCQKRIKDEGLKDENDLQTYFMNRMIKYLHARGREAIGWNEILESDIDRRVVGQYWLRRMKKVVEHLRSGGRMVMSHYFHVYLDYNYGLIPLWKCYNYEPIPKKLESEFHGNVLGIEAPMWTEFASNPRHMMLYVFPRLIAVAENAWTRKEKKDYISFKKRLVPFLKRLNLLGIHYTSIGKTEPRGMKRLKLILKWRKQASELPE
ncbi:MAG: beta-N-acetylhexosaminidase [Promethearchaeota archaeon]